jgi:hypothetical protein
LTANRLAGAGNADDLCRLTLLGTSVQFNTSNLAVSLSVSLGQASIECHLNVDVSVQIAIDTKGQPATRPAMFPPILPRVILGLRPGGTAGLGLNTLTLAGGVGTVVMQILEQIPMPTTITIDGSVAPAAHLIVTGTTQQFNASAINIISAEVDGTGFTAAGSFFDATTNITASGTTGKVRVELLSGSVLEAGARIDLSAAAAGSVLVIDGSSVSTSGGAIVTNTIITCSTACHSNGLGGLCQDVSSCTGPSCSGACNCTANASSYSVPFPGFGCLVSGVCSPACGYGASCIGDNLCSTASSTGIAASGSSGFAMSSTGPIVFGSAPTLRVFSVAPLFVCFFNVLFLSFI